MEHAPKGAGDKSGASAQCCRRNNDDFLKDRETPALERRLIASLCVSLVPLDVSVHGTYDVELAVAGISGRQSCGNGTGISCFLTTIVMVINQKFFISGFKRPDGIERRIWTHWSPLVLAASFMYSVYALFAMTDAQMRVDMDAGNALHA